MAAKTRAFPTTAIGDKTATAIEADQVTTM